METRSVWLWLATGWVLAWLAEAYLQPSGASLCDLGPCRCVRGRLLCDCSTSNIQEVVLKDLEEGRFSSISVVNCASLHLPGGELSRLPALQQVMVSNVSRLVLEERSFSFRPAVDTPQDDTRQVVVNISRVLVPEIPSYCFRGLLRAVLMSETRVEVLRPYAFSALDRLDQLAFHSVHLALVEPQAFKKLTVDYLSVKDSWFDTIPTRAMVDVEVHDEVLFENVTIDTVKQHGIKIHGPRHFKLSRSSIQHVEHQAFHVHTRGSASLLDNTFKHVEKSAFIGFTVERRYKNEFGKQDFKFENNTLVDFESAPLVFNTSGFNPSMDRILIGQQCSCEGADYWTSDLVFFSSESRDVTPAPHVATVLYCQHSATPTNVKHYRRLFCNVQDSNILLTVVFITAAIVSTSVLLMFAYCGLKGRARRYINVPNSPSPLKQNKNHVLVVPDAKTYRETELHVIVERTEPITPTEFLELPQGTDHKT